MTKERNNRGERFGRMIPLAHHVEMGGPFLQFLHEDGSLVSAIHADEVYSFWFRK